MTLDVLAWASFICFVISLVNAVWFTSREDALAWSLLTAGAIADYFLVGAVRGAVT